MKRNLFCFLSVPEEVFTIVEVFTKNIRMRIHIQAIQFTASEQLVSFIEKKINKLEHFYDRITDVEVYLSLDNKSSHIKDKLVRIKVNLPRVQIVASERSKVFETAADLSIDSVKRQLKRYKEKLRGQ